MNNEFSNLNSYEEESINTVKTEEAKIESKGKISNCFNANIRSQPYNNSPLVKTLREGSLVTILDERDGYYYVKCLSGGFGWVNKKVCEVI